MIYLQIPGALAAPGPPAPRTRSVSAYRSYVCVVYVMTLFDFCWAFPPADPPACRRLSAALGLFRCAGLFAALGRLPFLFDSGYAHRNDLRAEQDSWTSERCLGSFLAQSIFLLTSCLSGLEHHYRFPHPRWGRAAPTPPASSLRDACSFHSNIIMLHIF